MPGPGGYRVYSRRKPAQVPTLMGSFSRNKGAKGDSSEYIGEGRLLSRPVHGLVSESLVFLWNPCFLPLSTMSEGQEVEGVRGGDTVLSKSSVFSVWVAKYTPQPTCPWFCLLVSSDILVFWGKKVSCEGSAGLSRSRPSLVRFTRS